MFKAVSCTLKGDDKNINKINPQKMEKRTLKNENFWKIRLMDIIQIITIIFGLGYGYSKLESDIDTIRELRKYDMVNIKENLSDLKVAVKDLQKEVKLQSK